MRDEHTPAIACVALSCSALRSWASAVDAHLHSASRACEERIRQTVSSTCFPATEYLCWCFLWRLMFRLILTLTHCTPVLFFIACIKQQFEFDATAKAAAVTSCYCKSAGGGGGALPLKAGSTPPISIPPRKRVEDCTRVHRCCSWRELRWGKRYYWVWSKWIIMVRILFRNVTASIILACSACPRITALRTGASCNNVVVCCRDMVMTIIFIVTCSTHATCAWVQFGTTAPCIRAVPMRLLDNTSSRSTPWVSASIFTGTLSASPVQSVTTKLLDKSSGALNFLVSFFCEFVASYLEWKRRLRRGSMKGW